MKNEHAKSADELRALLHCARSRIVRTDQLHTGEDLMVDRAIDSKNCNNITVRLMGAQKRLFDLGLLTAGAVTEVYPDMTLDELSHRSDKLLFLVEEIEQTRCSAG